MRRRLFILVGAGAGLLASGGASAGTVGWKSGLLHSNNCQFTKIQQALDNAHNQNPPVTTGTIYLKPSGSPFNSDDTIDIDGTWVIRQGDGNCSDSATGSAVQIASNGFDRTFTVESTGVLGLRDVAVAGADLLGGTSATDGGVFYLDTGAVLELHDVAVSQSLSNMVARGGCIFAVGAEIDLFDTTFDGCRAWGNSATDEDGDGGGLFLSDDSDLLWVGGSLTGPDPIDTLPSSAAHNGGGIYAEGSVLTLVEDVTIDASADNQGGGLFLNYTPADLHEVTVTDCNAYQGAGIFAEDYSDLSLLECTISDNTATGGGGGLLVGSNLTVGVGSSSITGNTALFGGGIWADEGGGTTLVDLQDATTIEHNYAETAGGLYVSGYDADGVDVRLFDTVQLTDNHATNGGGGGALVTGPAKLELHDDVQVIANTATSGAGDGILLTGFENTEEYARLQVEGSPVTAPVEDDPDSTDALVGGVRIEGNLDGDEVEDNYFGHAIFADFATADLENTVIAGHVAAVQLVDGAEMTATNSHFWGNGYVFVLDDDDTSLTVQSDFGSCDPLAIDPFSPYLPLFAANRYCSEIRENGTQLLVMPAAAAIDVLFQATAITSNHYTGSPAIEVKNTAHLTMTTCMVEDNEYLGESDQILVDVLDGGDLVAKQNTFADYELPVKYEDGSTGDFKRNAVNATGSPKEVFIHSGATLTGGCNIGNWDGDGTMPTDAGSNTIGGIGWVTTGRGANHLDCTSILDGCTTDGPFDIDGNPRPSPAGLWDQGAVEYIQVEICDDEIDNDCDTLVDGDDDDCDP